MIVANCTAKVLFIMVAQIMYRYCTHNLLIPLT
jgi:hypothetical protein